MRVVKSLSIILCVFFLLIPGKILPVQLGSDSSISCTPSFISIVPYSVFPNTDTNNAMLAFGFFKYGFGLQDSTTSCTFSSVFPVSGQVSLHGGKLYLDTDLVLQNITKFVTPGIIYGQSHVLDFCQSVTGIPATYTTRFDNTALFLHADLTISGTINFTGNCIIDGAWSGLILGSDANIVVGHNASLELRNLDISNISGYRIRCLDNSGTLLLNNVQWGQAGNYTFTMGSILFENTVNVIGQNTFCYASALTATISTNSLLHFSTNSIFSIGRKTGFRGREPLSFVDNNSMLGLENSTLHVTSSGARLTKGLILLEGEVFFDINSTTSLGGLYIGNGQAQNDITLELYSGAAFSLENGHFINDNVFQNFLSASINKSFVRQSTNTFFYSNRSLIFSDINVINATNGQTILGPNAHLYFDNCYLNTPFGDFQLTATLLNTFEYLLPGNGNVTIDVGLFPIALAVKGTGNSLLGMGDMLGSIFLQDGGSQLFIQLGGIIFSNISSAGSSIVLIRDLTFTKDVVITGSANVNLETCNLTVQLEDTVWTSTIAWSGIGGTLNLISDFSLASPMTFNGDCIIQGNGNTFEIVSGGSITVGPNSTLQFKNVRVTGITGNNIRCADDSSNIIFDRVRAILSGDYSFTTGSMLFSDVVQLNGPYIWSYESNITSTIDENATVHFDKSMTFSYGPTNQRQDLISFNDASSTVYFDSNTSLYIGSGGLALTTGSAIFNANVSIIVDDTAGSGSSGLSIGNNVSNNDFTVTILSGATIDLLQGVITYRNVDSSSWNMVSNASILRLEAGTQLQLDQTLDLDNGLLQFSQNALLTNAPGKTVIGSTSVF